ncbi:DUF805 domain-containing protein [Leucobacter allii]|uniref:DUF805 domain-containing protein n=1 Tax=Leucobacter allii TaxID=2932247 RepID=A0ABY4FL18_9MICO|nr:DUF805 domain-containing protein [Leucobacter allii]UOQ56956.1 DUF805 domain-containing protein [Leucobacter allii]
MSSAATTPRHATRREAPHEQTVAAPGPAEDPGAVRIGLDPHDGRPVPALVEPAPAADLPEAARRLLAGYARFAGRASRREYWWAVLLLALLQLLPCAIVIVGVLRGAEGAPLVVLGTGVAVLLGLVFALPVLALNWRRFRDAGAPAPLALVLLLPGVGPLVAGAIALSPARAERAA